MHWQIMVLSLSSVRMGILVVMTAAGSENQPDPVVRAPSLPTDPVLSLPSQTVTLPALMSVAAGATSLPTDVVVPLSSETVGVPTAMTGVAGD